MVERRKRIEVPESIAREVKLFAKLLEVGEITSVYDLLQELEKKSSEEFEGGYLNFYDVSTLEYFWSAILWEIRPSELRVLFAKEGRLSAYNQEWALIELSSKELVKSEYNNIPKIEAAFESIFGHKVAVQLTAKIEIW